MNCLLAEAGTIARRANNQRRVTISCLVKAQQQRTKLPLLARVFSGGTFGALMQVARKLVKLCFCAQTIFLLFVCLNKASFEALFSATEKLAQKHA